MAALTCYYEVLGVPQDATAAAIKKSYHAKALKYHPDKNSGDDAATARFKEVQEAYEILSDPQERAYYDDNREDVLGSDEEDEKEYHEVEAELDAVQWCSREAFVDFSNESDGFFGVYSSVFQGLHAQECSAKAGDVDRPHFGSSSTDDVTAFYTYWLNFATCRSDAAFAKHDKWDLAEAPGPVARRLMQQKNKGIRLKARNMFNDKVRRVAAFARSQDPRHCGRVEVDGECSAAADDPNNGGAAAATDEFHCAACNKRYKNAQQLSNHEKSSKHKQQVAKLKAQLSINPHTGRAHTSAHAAELEELVMEAEGEEAGAEGAESVEGVATAEVVSERQRRQQQQKEQQGERAAASASASARGDGDGDDDAALAAAMEVALPSPGLVALQTRQAFESSDEFKKMNKTQRRKALQQWEAENARLVEQMRAEGKDAKPSDEAAPKEKKPEPATAKKDNTSVHGRGAHSREIKTPGKKKKEYGKPQANKGPDKGRDAVEVD